MACSLQSKKKEVQQLLQQSDSVLWKSKAEARNYAQQALGKAIEINDAALQSYSLQRLANAVRVTESLTTLLNYDSAAVAKARQAKDSIALFNGLDAYTKDFLSVNNIAAADSLLSEAAVISKQLKNSIYEAKYLHALGLFNFKSFQHEKAKESFEASLLLSQKSRNGYLSALNKMKIFQANQYLGVHDTTATNAFEAVEFFRENHYPDEEATTWFAIGENYRYIGNIAKAQEYYIKANELLVQHENYLIAGVIQNTIFQTMVSTGNFLEAKMAVDKMDIYFTRIDYTIGKGLAQNYWGQYYTAVNKFDKADSAFNNADSIAVITGYQPLAVMTNMYRSALLDKQHKAEEADSVAILSYAATQKYVSNKLLNSIYTDKNGKSISDAEKKLFLDSNYVKDSADAYLKALRAQNDSNESPIYKPLLTAYDSSTAMSFNLQAIEMETQYKTRIINDSLQLQKQQVLLNESEIRQKNIIIIAAIALLLLVATSLYLQYRSRRRAERDKQRIELLQNEIHHRVKNNLAVVNRLVEVAGKNSVEEAPLAALKSRIKSIELLHNHLYSEKADAGNIALQPYFEDLCVAIAATFESAKNIQIGVQAPVEVDSAIAEKLGLILNELVTNSYKYAFDGKTSGAIQISAEPLGKELRFAVQDNGVGMQTSAGSKSYGMKLIRGLSHELKGKFTFQNTNGTAFELLIPLTTA